MPDNGGTACQRVPSALFYEQLMFSHASVRAVRYYGGSLSPLAQTHLVTHNTEQEENMKREKKKRCC